MDESGSPVPESVLRKIVFDAKTQLTSAICETNYRRFLKEWDCASTCGHLCWKELSSSLPTTHTVAFTNIEEVMLDLEKPGLVCVFDRNPEELDANSDKWSGTLEAGLHHYVFAYHGIHWPYYSRSKGGLRAIPVGLFLSTALEKADVQRTNATYRDLYLGLPSPASSWFLMPSHARELCAYEVALRFGGDFWAYWGNPFSSQALLSKWKDFYEFHFLSRVPPEQFAAVLIPDRKVCNSDGVITTSRLALINVEAEIHGRWPSIPLLYYDYSPDDPDTDFLKASFSVAKFFEKHGRFPKQIGEAQLGE